MKWFLLALLIAAVLFIAWIVATGPKNDADGGSG